MYGVIFTFLKEYVEERHGGNETWRKLLKASTGQAYKLYFPVVDYPDEEIVALAQTAADALSLPLPAVLEDFGSYVGPRLMSFYPMYLKNNIDNTFDMIIHAGANIHDAIHRHNPERKPPQLSAHRESDNILIIHYQSHRRLCHVVRGIVRGLGERFNEEFTIEETQCMYHGAVECIIKVTKK
ncbi:MAG: hypothetical protein GQ546_02910 [Gammaproteobacteria bacterium]|nr:hypothetical protein [Gammaproteobacteria bacterium]